MTKSACWCRWRRREAISHLEEIAAVPGIDGIFVGPADLAASHGPHRQFRASGCAGGDSRCGLTRLKKGRQARRHPHAERSRSRIATSSGLHLRRCRQRLRFVVEKRRRAGQALRCGEEVRRDSGGVQCASARTDDMYLSKRETPQRKIRRIAGLLNAMVRPFPGNLSRRSRCYHPATEPG